MSQKSSSSPIVKWIHPFGSGHSLTLALLFFQIATTVHKITEIRQFYILNIVSWPKVPDKRIVFIFCQMRARACVCVFSSFCQSLAFAPLIPQNMLQCLILLLGTSNCFKITQI